MEDRFPRIKSFISTAEALRQGNQARANALRFPTWVTNLFRPNLTRR